MCCTGERKTGECSVTCGQTGSRETGSRSSQKPPLASDVLGLVEPNDGGAWGVFGLPEFELFLKGPYT